MTIRGLASAILTAAVRRASPAGREWGTAMLREMDFVESDWAALFWALGSAAVLFKRLEAPMNGPADVFLRARELMKKIHRRTLLGYGACLIIAVAFGSFVFTSRNAVQRNGAGLTVTSGLYLAYQLYRRRGLELSSGIHSSVCTTFYRAELERQRDFHRGMWFWSRLLVMIPGPLLYCMGSAMAYPALALGWTANAICFIVLGIAAVPLNLRLSRKYQRQIDELDALPKTPNTP